MMAILAAGWPPQLPGALDAALVVIGAALLGGLIGIGPTLGRRIARWTVVRGATGGVGGVLLLVGLLGVSGPAALSSLAGQAGQQQGQSLGPGGGSSTAPGASGAPSGAPAQGSALSNALTGSGNGSHAGASGGTTNNNITYSGDHPGVTASTITIGFVVATNLQAADAAFGVSAVQGDPQQQGRMIVDWINHHGGIAGRTVQAQFAVLDGTSSTSPTQQASQQCKHLTEDVHVFAVIDAIGGNDYAADACYIQHHTLVLDMYDNPGDVRFFQQNYPFYWAPDGVALDAVLNTEVRGLAQQGFFGVGTSLGVVTADDDVHNRLMSNVLPQALKAVGFNGHVEIYKASATDANQAAAQLQNAAVQFHVDGVNHVIFSAASGTAFFFMTGAQSNGYFPTYGFNSFDAPQAVNAQGSSAITQEEAGAMGVGWSAYYDTNDSESGEPGFPSSANAMESLCYQIMKDQAYTSRGNQTTLVAWGYCSGAVLLQIAGNKLGADFTVQRWAAAAAGLGTSVRMARNYESHWSSSRLWGADGYKFLKFDSGCSCWRYTSNTLYQFPQ